MIKFHTAKEMLKAAAAAGLQIKVWGDDNDAPEYFGANPAAAWQAVAGQDEAEITLHNADGTRVKGGWAFLLADGPGTCDPQETVVDYSADGWISDWWNANREAILA